MNCIICLFSGASAEILRNLDELSQNMKPGKKSAAKILAETWEKSLERVENVETALFLPGLLYSGDEFSDRYRRFVQVGAQREDQVQNVFELAFEKGYDRTIFVEDFGAFCETKIFSEAIQALEEKDMVFAPKPDGSLFLWGMNAHAYNTVFSFQSDKPEFVVDQISHCIEYQISYKLLPGMDPEQAWGTLRTLFQNQ